MSAEAQSVWSAARPAAPEIGPILPSAGISAADPRQELEQLKNQFLASLNHEIRTPLSGLLGMADLLGETRLDAEQTEFLTGIRECAGQLMDTLNAVLEYTSIASGQLGHEESEFHILQVLEAVAAEWLAKAEAKGLRLLFHVEDGLPETAIGDARHLRQAIRHLMRNAVKFTDRGEVELAAGAEQIHTGNVLLGVTVRDTGIGIPEDKLNLLFESFRQLEGGLARRHPGLGLGLALVDRLARLMNGSIQVESRPGVGSSFSLRVPLRLAASAPLHAGRVAAAPARRILLVDDNKIAREVVGHILGRAGFDVDFAENGERALQMAAGSHYDLVLMDLQMPGMDGLTATRYLRGINGYGHVPVVALTANSDDYRYRCDQAGMHGFLAKPFQKEELLATVRTLLA
jgi:CheY-like chemotaxis protein